jgi:flagellar basal-body rod modification protein FlgD
MTAVDPFASLRLGASSAASTSSNSSSTSGTSNQFGEDTFLKLLVAQLKYQNPLDPQDGTQFLTQTAQFTMVEKLESIDKETKTALAANQLLSAASMIGLHVKYKDNDGNDQTGVVKSVKVTSDGPTLKIGDQDISYAAIEEINPETTSAASST